MVTSFRGMPILLEAAPKFNMKYLSIRLGWARAQVLVEPA
jgi:hypothetical protein